MRKILTFQVFLVVVRVDVTWVIVRTCSHVNIGSLPREHDIAVCK